MQKKEIKSIYVRYRENTILAIISTSIAIVSVLLAYNYVNKYDNEHKKRIYIEEKYKLLEEDYLRLQKIYKEGTLNDI